jgi:uncharacterized protein (DUF2147 family)
MVLAVCVACSSAFAQLSPVGLWKTIDDKSGAPKSEVRITEDQGLLSAKIEKVYRANFKGDEKCLECKDDRKDQPLIGLEILRGLKQAGDKAVWEGGTVLDPMTGTVYKAKITLIDGGAQLEMRGFVGFSLLGRTQTWVRIQ